uniref:Uncharacterized protein n=1 Tax=Laticauda laticaudata TaxID=8630 RepID=A0A8C5WMU3_LATLA
MDGKAKLPNFTESINWQGLKDLYSVNESLYEARNNNSIHSEDWRNYLKDVDRIFALLNSYSKQNQRAETPTFNTSRDLDESSTSFSLLGMSSAEINEGLSGLTTLEPQPIFPTYYGDLTLSTVVSSKDGRLELSNDIPAKRNTNGHQAKTWLKIEEPIHSEMDFSGNDLTELESRHTFILQPINIIQKASMTDKDFAQGIFEEPVYLPMNSGAKTISWALNTLVLQHKTEMLRTRESFQKSQFLNEGSASNPIPSD